MNIDNIDTHVNLGKGAHSHRTVEIRNVKGLQEGMKMRKLPNSELVVSEICLGTMNFGDQLSKDSSLKILDAAFNEYGINFLDTAETYPVPSAPSTTGKSELIIGDWLKKRGGKKKRAEVIVSSKVSGFSDQITWCRRDGSGTRVNKAQVMEAVDAQLKRLGTDYIDLLHIHWPDRYVPLFGAPEYSFNLERPDATPIAEQLEIMNELIKSGKIRHFGLSNETPYGVGAFCTMADALGLPRPIVSQSAYSLLVRNDFETGMMEACSPINGNLGLLAYSPLAGGALTGKYLKQNAEKLDPKSRLRQYVGFMHRYIAAPATVATQEYQDLADAFSLPLGPLALAWVYSRPFVSSTIIGVSSLAQLHDNILALNIPIDAKGEIAAEIEKIYRRNLDPTKGVFEVVDPNIEYIDPSILPWGAKDEDVDPELDVLINQRMSRF